MIGLVIGAAVGVALGFYPAWRAITGFVDWGRGELVQRGRTKPEIIAEALFGFGCLSQAAHFLIIAANSN